MNAYRSFLTALVFTLGASSVSAQGVPVRLGAGVAHQSFSFSAPERISIESLSLTTVPLGARARLARDVDLELGTVWASGRLVREDGSESTLSGLTDSELRLAVRLGRDLVTLTGIALIPTGIDALSIDEADLAGAIAADVLPFRVSNWGTGGGFGASAAVARTIGSVAAGLSVGYVVAREFEPLRPDAFTYRPGNQLSVRAAIDRTLGTSGKVALVASMQRYADDQIDGSNLFRSGDRYDVMGSYAFAAGARGAGIFYLGYLRRGQGEFLDDTGILAAQDLVLAGAGADLPAGSVRLKPSLELRVLRRDDGISQGHTAGGGADIELPLARLMIVPGFRARFGNILLRQDAESRFTGVEVGMSVRFGS